MISKLMTGNTRVRNKTIMTYFSWKRVSISACSPMSFIIGARKILAIQNARLLPMKIPIVAYIVASIGPYNAPARRMNGLLGTVTEKLVTVTMPIIAKGPHGPAFVTICSKNAGSKTPK